MAGLKIRDSRSIRISVTPNKSRVRLRFFGTAAAGPYDFIEFEFEAIVALAVAEEIRKLIPPGDKPVGPGRARAIRKSNLQIVK